MTTFAGYYSPIEQSMKPKGYFVGTKELMKSKLMHSSVSILAKRPKTESKKEGGSMNPYMRELLVVTPWVVTAAVIFISIAL